MTPLIDPISRAPVKPECPCILDLVELLDLVE